MLWSPKLTSMPTIATHPERGPRWGLVGVLCAVLLGLVGLYGFEMHCSAQETQQAVHSPSASAPHQQVMHGDSSTPASLITTTSLTEQQSGPGDGDLVLCALAATCLALLISAVSVGRSGAARLARPRTFRARCSRPRESLLPRSTFIAVPLRC